MSKKKLVVDPKAFDVSFRHGDIGKTTVRGFLVALLAQVWEEEEGFSGKRPWGNSGWKHDLEAALIKSGFANGALDEDGCVADEGNTDAVIATLIAALAGIDEKGGTKNG